MISTWTHGYHVVWTPHGFHMDTMWCPGNPTKTALHEANDGKRQETPRRHFPGGKTMGK